MTQNVNDIASFLVQSESSEPVIESTEIEQREAVEVDEAEYDEYEAESDDDYADDDNDESEPEPERFTVKVDGEEIEVTRDELLNGYQRDADYRRKTMSLSDERKAIEAKGADIDSKLVELDSFIERKSEALTEDLMVSDPGEYLKRKAEIDKAQKVADAAREERNKELSAKQESYMQEEIGKLVQTMGGDDWTNEQRNVDMKRASEYLTDLGVSEEEQKTIVDHRLWRAIFDASKAQKVEDVSKRVREQRRQAPKSVKPGQKVPAGERKISQATKRLSNSTKHSAASDLADLLIAIDN